MKVAAGEGQAAIVIVAGRVGGLSATTFITTPIVEGFLKRGLSRLSIVVKGFAS